MLIAWLNPNLTQKRTIIINIFIIIKFLRFIDWISNLKKKEKNNLICYILLNYKNLFFLKQMIKWKNL